MHRLPALRARDYDAQGRLHYLGGSVATKLDAGGGILVVHRGTLTGGVRYVFRLTASDRASGTYGAAWAEVGVEASTPPVASRRPPLPRL